MMLWGIFGGPLVSALYWTDFWRPAMARVYTPFEAVLFGSSFLGIVTALTLWWAGHALGPERPRTVLSKRKVYLLLAVILAGLGLWGLGTNSVVATTAALFVGTIFLVGQRPDLAPIAFRGALVSLTSYATLIAVFILMVANSGELARAFSPFYVQHGLVQTEFVLGFWAAAFGAFFGPFVPWAKNLRLLPR